MTLSAAQVDDERNLNIAVIGTGRWGKTLARAIGANAALTVVAAISSGSAAAKTVDDAVPVFPTWQTAVETFSIDGFVLAVPPDIQPPIAEKIIAAGFPVFLEKPLALTRDAARRLLAVARSTGFTGLVDHVHLFAPEFVELCRRLPTGQGAREIKSVSGNRGPYRDRWSACWDWAPHDIAMCLAVMGSAPQSVTARIVRTIEHDGHEFENYEISLDFGQRGQAVILTGNAFDSHCREFSVQSGDARLTYTESESRQRSLIMDRNGHPEAVDMESVPPLDAALGIFADRIRRNTGGIEDLEQGVLVVEICTAAHESVASSAPVSIARYLNDPD
jgi:predicted dehydrogenase